MKPLASTAVRHDHDGRNWDFRIPIEPPPMRKATWIARILIAAFVLGVIVSIAVAP